jgi:hypothetical protein
MTQRRIVGTGQATRVDDPVHRIPTYDPRAGNHYWVVITSYNVDPTRWYSEDPTVLPLLDTENLVSVTAPGCYHCEQYYTPGMEKRRCPGEPR